MAALDLPAGVTIDGALKPGFEKVLTKEAVAFVADLQRKFNARREELLAGLSAAERSALDDLSLRLGAMPAFDPADALMRANGMEVRAALLHFELLTQLRFASSSVDGNAGERWAELHAASGANGAMVPLLRVSRPSQDVLLAQLQRVQALAPLRDSRTAEVLTQVAPPLAYFASVLNLQSGRHAKTTELLKVALQFSYAVCMRFKQALAVPRPSAYTAQIQPMIEVPMHPSYPAGHALEAHVSATVLGALAEAPGRPADNAVQKQLLRRLATRISENRVVAGVHYPVDCVVGRLMGDALASYLLAACEPARAWRGARYAGHLLDPATDGLRDFSATGHAFEDGLPGEAPAMYPAPELPLLQKLWSLARAEWA